MVVGWLVRETGGCGRSHVSRLRGGCVVIEERLFRGRVVLERVAEPFGLRRVGQFGARAKEPVATRMAKRHVPGRDKSRQNGAGGR